MSTLNRSIATWEKSDPTGMSSMSKGAIFYALQDAKHDILHLNNWLIVSNKKRDELTAINAELLEALKKIKNRVHGYTDDHIFKIAKQAIDKAEGKGE